MNLRRIVSLFPALVAVAFAALGCAPNNYTLEPPATDRVPSTGPRDIVLVNGRKLTPAGVFLLTQSYSWGMAISPDESAAVLMSEDALQFLDISNLKVVDRIPPFGQPPPKEIKGGTYMGCAFAPDGKRVYIGDANGGAIISLRLDDRKFEEKIDLNTDGYKDSFIGDLTLSSDGKKLFVVDQHNYRMIAVDLEQKKVLWTTPVGRSPFGIRLSPGEEYAWVSNVGMFEYPLLPGVTKENRGKAGLEFPPYGVPSKEAEFGTEVNGQKIPGLGSPNHPDAMSVFKVNLRTGKVEARIKTGYLVGVRRDDITTVGGASPCTVAVGHRYIYVANATNDTISIIDTAADRIVGEIELSVPRMAKLRGVLPFGVSLSPDEKKLYVACAGLNAVAVVDTDRRRVQGYIPAGWFCSFVRTSRDGRQLFVSSVKGVGSGPNGGRDFVKPARGTHPADIMQGLFQVIPAPTESELERYTEQVINNTYRLARISDDGRNPLPPAPGLRKSPIRHIVFIVKENRTFDQVLGQRRNVIGDPTLAEFGLKQDVRNKTVEIEKVDVTPNHHALADQFAISDNFYCDSDQSNTGHRWVAGVYPNEWVEVNARSRIEERLFSSAPGRRYVSFGNGVVNPEDYNEAGAMWEHLLRHNISFFNFGFGTEMPASLEEQVHKYTGMHMAVAFPLPKPLFDNTSRRFATYNMSITDQFRVDMFEQDYKEKWESGREPFPRLITMVLPQDHTAAEKPEAGYPFRASYVADNDLALARVMHKLSHSPYWKDMLIIVTEDDPQGGSDHVDAHRSVLMLISPHVKHGYVSHTLANFGSIMKMIFVLLDLPHLNQFDAAASLPADFFTDQPDYTPYAVRPVDKRLFDPETALKPFDRGFNWKSLLDSPEMDDPDDMRKGFNKKKDDDD
jgi:YVTN family beta-propeller protein